MGGLSGKVAIITGAGRGIGRAAALLFAREDALVIIATRTKAPGDEAARIILNHGGRAEVVEVDVSGRQAIIELVDQTSKKHGRLDIVLHNAAHLPNASIENLTDHDIDLATNLNFKAAFWLTAAALPHLQKTGGGRLLFVSSITGNRHAHPGYALYGATKAGLNGFIRQAGFELASKGITVNAVEPGIVRTEAVEAALTLDQLRMIERMIPRGSAATPEDVAGTLLFLASDAAAHITGQTIIIDGGQSLGVSLAAQ